MANFKGGFAFNNEAAKVEVEQAPDGTLISCVNPVTGESLNGGNYSETYEGTAAEIVIDTEAHLPNLVREGDASIYFTFDMAAFGLPSTTIMVSRAVGTYLYANNIVYNESGFSGLYAVMDFSQGHNITGVKLLLVTEGNITDGTAYAASVPVTMTINYHPMP